jgi:ABC-type dipeptide/oligopeptide/nickel transport system ATPase subunit
MKAHTVTLTSPVSTSYRCTRAANSLDIDAHKKATHHLEVQADLESPYNVGLIVGASGSGKTTLAKQVWGPEVFREVLDLTRPVIEQFPESMSYDDCVSCLVGVGLTSVPCWIRPAATLSNGQRVRAECALRMATSADGDLVVIDEWTSVVDRTVAKVMSHCIQKHARKTGKRIVLLSCHYDVAEWVNPDWVIDCNRAEYTDRRLLCRSHKRTEQLDFQIREIDRESWRYFSKYHYLTDRLPGGQLYLFGLFNGDEQIGFQCFANYVPHRPGTRKKFHSNRTVIHPDYAGMGMGIMVINETSRIMQARGHDIWARFSSTPIYVAMSRQKEWKLDRIERKHGVTVGGSMKRESGFRLDVKMYSFRYVGEQTSTKKE